MVEAGVGGVVAMLFESGVNAFNGFFDAVGMVHGAREFEGLKEVVELYAATGSGVALVPILDSPADSTEWLRWAAMVPDLLV
ncbi:hypothetical protein GCM10027346_10490 [Hymenobacter seoulensis]